MSKIPCLIGPVIGLVLWSTAGQAQEAGDVAAEVNGSPIMTADIDSKLGNNLAKIQEQIFDLRQQQLDALIDQKLLEDEAARRGVTIAALVQYEVAGRVTKASTEEARQFFEQNQARLQGDFDSLQESITNFLDTQRMQTRQREFLAALREAADIEVLLERPPIFRSDVATAGAPVRGAGDAPVTIVEFSDFHCPFCRRIQSVLDQVRENYGDRVKIVYRDFALDNLHPAATTVAHAARCATEQGKFWEFHDQVFANEPDGAPVTLDRFAEEVGMDVSAFQTCRTSGKYTSSIRASQLEGAQLGITGTPTFFINGRMLVGAQPIDAFSKIIDEELAAAGEPTDR